MWIDDELSRYRESQTNISCTLGSPVTWIDFAKIRVEWKMISIEINLSNGGFDDKFKSKINCNSQKIHIISSIWINSTSKFNSPLNHLSIIKSNLPPLESLPNQASSPCFYLSKVTRPVPFLCFEVLHKEKHVLLHSWQMSLWSKVLCLLLSSVFSLSFCRFYNCFSLIAFGN